MYPQGALDLSVDDKLQSSSFDTVKGDSFGLDLYLNLFYSNYLFLELI